MLVVVAVAAIGAGAFFLFSGGSSSGPESTVRSFISAINNQDCSKAVDATTLGFWGNEDREGARELCEEGFEGEYSLDSLDVDENDDRATVSTEGNWEPEHAFLANDMSFTLIREDGKWLIDRVGSGDTPQVPDLDDDFDRTDESSSGPEDTVRSFISALNDHDCGKGVELTTPNFWGADDQDSARELCEEDDDSERRYFIHSVDVAQRGDEATVSTEGRWEPEDEFMPADEMSFVLIREDGQWLIHELVVDFDDDFSTPPGGGTLGPASQPPSGEPEHDVAAQSCFQGDMQACDDLYWATSVGSPYEDYGATCGGRLPEWDSGNCASNHGPFAD